MSELTERRWLPSNHENIVKSLTVEEADEMVRQGRGIYFNPPGGLRVSTECCCKKHAAPTKACPDCPIHGDFIQEENEPD